MEELSSPFLTKGSDLKELSYFNKIQISDAIKESEKTHLRDLDLKGLTYEQKRELLEICIDEWIDIFCINVRVVRGNGLVNTLREIAKNSVDHNSIGAHFVLQYIKNLEDNTLHIHFLLLDDGGGLPYSPSSLDKLFSGGSTTNWTKTGERNFGIGLGMIRNFAETLNLDLVLHNKLDMYHIHDAKLLPQIITPQEKFGYEGYGIFSLS